MASEKKKVFELMPHDQSAFHCRTSVVSFLPAERIVAATLKVSTTVGYTD